MGANVAYLRRTALVAIGVISVIGIGGPVGAEPISSPIAEHTPGDAASPGAWPETAIAGSPASNSSGVEGAKNTATVTNPVQEQPQGDGRSPLAPNKRPEQQLSRSGSQSNELAGSAETATGLYEDWTLDREFKEAIRPLYEDLKATGVVEAVRTLKSDLGLKSSSMNDQTSSESSRELEERLENRSANQSRTQSTVQTEQDRSATAALWKELVEELKPWLFGLAGLYIFGYVLKLWRDYVRWKTTRYRKRSSKSKRHHLHHRHHRRHRHHQRPQGTPEEAVLDPGTPRAGN